VIWTSWAHVWRLRSFFLGTGCDRHPPCSPFASRPSPESHCSTGIVRSTAANRPLRWAPSAPPSLPQMACASLSPRPSSAAGASTATLDHRCRPHHQKTTVVASSALLTVDSYPRWAFTVLSVSGGFAVLRSCSYHRPSDTLSPKPPSAVVPPQARWVR
jgi:hypothetical protein